VSTFQPWRVADLNFEIGRTLPDVDGLTGPLFGIVRLHGVPVGYIESSGRPSGRDLTADVLRQHEDAILRHLLADALADGSFARMTSPLDLLDARHHAADHGGLSVTVAVCTRDRPADLARCLDAIDRLDYPSLDVIVIDNAPATDEAQHLVRADFPRVRYVRERLPGISRARNRAINETRTDLIAFVDDDVTLDANWARAVAAVMAENLDVMAVTGLVAPYELETAAQLDFERHLGWERRFERRWFRRRAGEPIGERLANAAKVGTGAAVAFRRRVFDEVGLFDPGLGTGTRARGGEDLDMFLRLLRAGHTVVYDPAALARHRHRRDRRALSRQLGGWASGMTAYLVRNMREHRGDRRRLAGFTIRLLLLYYPRRVAQSMASRTLRPLHTVAEFGGALTGLMRYQRRGGPADDAAGRPPSVTARAVPNPTPRSMKTLSLDLADPLPAILPATHNRDRIRVHVHRDGRRLGVVDLVCGGNAVSRLRVADAIAMAFWRSLLEPRDRWRRALRERCGLT
jgi:GT2 family glycosyltransferase